MTNRLGRLQSLHSRFRPQYPEKGPRLRLRQCPVPMDVMTIDETFVPQDKPAPQQPNSVDSSSSSSSSSSISDIDKDEDEDDQQPEQKLVSQPVTLDGLDCFSQLCTVVNLFYRGQSTTCVNLVDGVLRLWRDWLAEQAMRSALCGGGGGEEECNLRALDDPRILWVDVKKNIGLKLRIHERTNTDTQETPPDDFAHRQLNDEDTHTYEIEFEGRVIF